ncbi:hypothetical protein Tco_1328167 [Tanacetum coccineum]
MKVTFPYGSELKITPKKIWEVLGIPMGKNKLESDSPREYDDEFLKAFKEQFHGKKYIAISDLSKQIQRTINTDFMFQMNYLMLFSHCDNNSRLIYYVIKNIKSRDIDKCRIHISVCTDKSKITRKQLKTSKHGHKNQKSTKRSQRSKAEAPKPYENLWYVFKDDDNEDENEKYAEKRKLRELEHLLKEYTEMDELFSGDERLTLFVKKFKEEFTKGFRKDEERAGTSGVGNGDGNEDGAGNNEVDVKEENEQTEIGIDAEISVKEAAEEKKAGKASEMRQAAKKEATEKEAAEKEAAAKEKEEAEKITAAKKKEQAEKLAAAKKEKAEKLAATKKEQAEKLAAAKKKEEAEKLAAANKEQAEKLAATKKKEEAKKLAATKKKQAKKLAATKKKEEAEKKAAAEKEKAEKEVASKNDKKQLKKKASDEKKKEKTEKKAGAEKEETEKKKSLKEAPEKKDAGTAQTVLNYEERIRSGGKDKRRHYFPTNYVTANLMNKEKDEAKEYVSFKNMINNQMNTSESKKKMKDVTYAFFPVVAEG